MKRNKLTGAFGKSAGRLLCALSTALITSSGVIPSSSLHAAIYDVDIDSPQFTLYTDPYNGNEIKLGGFSGLYPVPGKPDCFYTITDRGPAPDFTVVQPAPTPPKTYKTCLLYTSDAADERSSVDLGGRRII